MLYDQLRNSNIPLCVPLIEGLIVSNKNKFGFVKQESIMLIMFMMKPVIMKGVNNFFTRLKGKGGGVYLAPDDLVGEFYIVLSRAVQLYDHDKKKSFYAYFNNAVNRRVSRMVEYKINQEQKESLEWRDGKNKEETLYPSEFLFSNSIFWDDLANVLEEQELGIAKSMVFHSKKLDARREVEMSMTDFESKLKSIKFKLNG